MIETAGITLERVQELYRSFGTDLARVRRYQRLLYEDRFSEQRTRERADLLQRLGAELHMPLGFGRMSWAQFDDLNAELTYLLLRAEQPEVVVEISPCGGWSTSWILNALRDNRCGHLISFDVIEDSVAKVPTDLAEGIRTFHCGDVRTSPHLPEQIDFLFVDSDHTGPFAEWYLREVFPRVRADGVVTVDDVFHPGGPAASGGEGTVVLDWLAQRGVPYFTAAPSVNRAAYEALQQTKVEHGLGTSIHFAETNPAIYFTMPG